MKILIITLHAMHNPGSVFQAYALQEYLNKQGREAVILDYRPDYFYTEGSAYKLLFKKILFYRSYNNRNNKFAGFVSSNLNLTKLYKSYTEIANDTFSYDLYMVGSDQLWNTDFECGKDPAFYLKFIKEGRKVSYSTSIGKAEYDIGIENILKKNLSDFENIAVREKSTSVYLSELLGRDVKWVCDPVFLLSVEDYNKFVGKRPVDEPYVMVYMSPKSEQLDKIVSYYKHKGYKIVLVGGFTNRCMCDIHVKDAGPEDFLTYIYYADMIVSTSFHATAFCHIFHKKFLSLIPNRNGERIISLLEKSGLLNRAISSPQNNYDIGLEEINWTQVDGNLCDYLEDSMDYLKHII